MLYGNQHISIHYLLSFWVDAVVSSEVAVTVHQSLQSIFFQGLLLTSAQACNLSSQGWTGFKPFYFYTIFKTFFCLLLHFLPSTKIEKIQTLGFSSPSFPLIFSLQQLHNLWPQLKSPPWADAYFSFLRKALGLLPASPVCLSQKGKVIISL